MVTRVRETRNNPAALLALMWHYATGGCGAKDMVILPYKDRLLLFSRYLQQLIMESIGKEFDRNAPKSIRESQYMATRFHRPACLRAAASRGNK